MKVRSKQTAIHEYGTTALEVQIVHMFSAYMSAQCVVLNVLLDV